MSTVVKTLTNVSIPSGTLNIPAVTVPNGLSVSSVSISIARCTTSTPSNWPNEATTLDLQLEASYDGGSTWEPGGGFTAVGGIVTLKDGVTEAQVSSGQFGYAQTPTNLRGSATVANGPLVSAQIVVSIN